MIEKLYFCTSCGFKSSNSDSLIKRKGGCASCGRSNYKCPKCGMIMKMIKTGVATGEDRKTFERAIKPVIGIRESRHGNIRIRRA